MSPFRSVPVRWPISVGVCGQDRKFHKAFVISFSFSFGCDILQNFRLRIICKGIFVSGISAESIIILGYFVFEGFLYGFAPSLVNIPANAVQGVAGLILGVILVKIFKKNKILR